MTQGLAVELGDGLLLANTLTLDEVVTAAARQNEGVPLVLTVIAATGEGAAERVEADLLSWRPDATPATTRYAAVGGDAAAVAAHLNELAELGVTSVAIEATRDEPDVDGLIAFLGREVAPLLR